jgi:deoxyribonuclease-2
MGNCFCTSNESLIKRNFAIKFPHNTQYIYNNGETGTFIMEADINVWIQNLYCVSNWPNWVVYNDDIHKISEKHTSHGHCKGILTWNNDRIGWLCHSVPNFPREFKRNKISMIEPSELIYGQSFQYIDIPYTKDMLYNIMHQINIMDSNIYNSNYTSEYKEYEEMKFPKINKFNLLKISEDIIHIAKPHTMHFDIYSDHIARNAPYQWKVQTWKRGHEITTNNMNIIDINKLKFEHIMYTTHQDHSKWAVSNDSYYWVGDLNRMTSQFKRGGGGFICRDSNIATELNKLVLE